VKYLTFCCRPEIETDNGSKSSAYIIQITAKDIFSQLIDKVINIVLDNNGERTHIALHHNTPRKNN